jgi:hypothetical protein
MDKPKKYYVNTDKDIHGNNEVHAEDCPLKPDFSNGNYIDLGTWSACETAVAVAQAIHNLPDADGCKWCAEDCHTE